MKEESQRAGRSPAEPRRWKASGDKPSGSQDQRLRIQFELTAAMLKEVDELVERGAFESRRDLFNSAYDLLQWAIEETTKGRLIAAVDEESGIYTAIHLPALAAVRRRIRKPRELRPVRPAALRSAR